jgi:hypothetical protein
MFAPVDFAVVAVVLFPPLLLLKYQRTMSNRDVLRHDSFNRSACYFFAEALLQSIGRKYWQLDGGASESTVIQEGILNRDDPLLSR